MTAAKAKSLTNWVGLGPMQEGREAASQNFKAGDPLLIDSAGNVAIAATAGNNITNAVTIAGVGAQDAIGTTNNKIRYNVITSRTRWKLPYYHATEASAVTALTDLDTSHCIRNDATQGVGWSMMLDNTTNPVCKIMEICGDNPIGELHGMCLVGFPAIVSTTRFEG